MKTNQHWRTPTLRKLHRPHGYFQAVQAKLVFPHKEDKRSILDLMRRFSSATPFAYNRLLEKLKDVRFV